MLLRLRLFGRAWLAFLLTVGVLVAWASPARATHIVGGEMELVHNSGESYTLILNFYFDAVGGSPSALDADLTASIFDKSTNRNMMNVVLPLVSNAFVNYTNPACAKPNLSTRRLVYSKNVLLPATVFNNPQGYYAAVERWGRNIAISNIEAPASAATAFYLEFPAVVRRGQPFGNSTPRIFPPLADYACRGELFYYDFAGQDVDGDSLVYDLVTPLNGHANASNPKPAAALPAPYAPIVWRLPDPPIPGAPVLPPLSETNQIPGNPTLTVNRFSGRLTVRPTDLGLFVFGVRCSEYRQGEKIGETRRDFQLMVLNCAPNNSPRLTVLPAPTGRVAYRPGRDTLRFTPTGNRCVRLKFTDPDPASRLTLSLHPVNFSGVLPVFTSATSGTVRTPGAPDTLSATLCFPNCLNTRGGVFLVDVVVGDDGCSLPRRDTVRIAFTAAPLPNGPPTLVATAGPTTPLVVRVGDLVTFDLTGADPDNDPVTLEMTGLGFTPTALGATLSQNTVGTQQRGRFTWRVDCRALGPDSLLRFQFAAATTPCNVRQAATLTVPIVVRYSNRAPVLAVSPALPPPSAIDVPPVVRLPLGDSYSLTFTGTDANNDPLTLTASSESFALAEAGMRFEVRTSPGAATGTFRWDVSCLAANLRRPLDVTFKLIDATCRPIGQSVIVRFEVVRPASPELRLYNIITPNGDGKNDAFRLPDLPVNFCDESFDRISIFSRWGQQVFDSVDRDFQWPGQGTGGLYYYLVTYTDGRRYKGWLEVVR